MTSIPIDCFYCVWITIFYYADKVIPWVMDLHQVLMVGEELIAFRIVDECSVWQFRYSTLYILNEVNVQRIVVIEVCCQHSSRVLSQTDRNLFSKDVSEIAPFLRLHEYWLQFDLS